MSPKATRIAHSLTDTDLAVKIGKLEIQLIYLEKQLEKDQSNYLRWKDLVLCGSGFVVVAGTIFGGGFLLLFNMINNS